MEEVAEMPKPKDDGPPRLIRMVPIKRKDSAKDVEHQQKKLKTGAPSLNNINSTEGIVHKDEQKGVDINVEENMQSNSDCNQNYITAIDEVTKHEELPKDPPKESNLDITDTNTPANEITPASPNRSMTLTDAIQITNSPTVSQRPPSTVVEAPMIEDISSDEEPAGNFRLHSTYDITCRNTMTNADPLEVSQCTLINGTIDCIATAPNSDFFEKPLVYANPVTPHRKSPKDLQRATNDPPVTVEKRQWNSLANITHFEEDNSSTTAAVHVQRSWELNYTFPQPGQHYPASPSYISLERVSPITSPRYYEDTRYPRVSPMTSPNRRFSPNFKSPSRSVPSSPIVRSPSSVVPAMSPVVAPGTPVVLETTAVVSAITPSLDNSRLNWQNWFAEEKRKGFFNFERSQSVESESAGRRPSVETAGDFCSNVPSENRYEIKIDSKTYRIKRSLYEKIPKGKLCYIRETNTFIRYFDDGQMELFIRNLNISEGSSVASDLLKQIKGRVEGTCDVETSLGQYEASGKSEIIKLSKDVTFSTADNLSDPELYVEEVEKVQRFVPRDFYGFYKYVTGYQIVNNHAPISFQTFLTMHNTNGIKGLFKNYINTLIKGHTVL